MSAVTKVAVTVSTVAVLAQGLDGQKRLYHLNLEHVAYWFMSSQAEMVVTMVTGDLFCVADERSRLHLLDRLLPTENSDGATRSD